VKNRQAALQRASRHGKVGFAELRRVLIMRRIATCLFVAVLLSACSRTPEEQRIRSAITAMQQAVEGHQPRDFMNYVSADFTGEDGTVDREGLANVLRAEVLRNDVVGVTLGAIDIQMQGNRATVYVTATLTGGSGGLLPEHGAIYAITSGWKRDSGDWRCYNASWEQKL
jgi:ketosteroid isomerase-like protein